MAGLNGDWYQSFVFKDPQRLLKSFTDRHEIVRLFAECLNDNLPDSPQIIFFYGDGGNGKSLLLEILRSHYCKRLAEENWSWIKRLPDEDFEHNLKEAQGAEAIPSVLLDFGLPATDDLAPRREYSALPKLRRDLRGGPGGSSLHFPLYEFAAAWYLREHLGKSKEMTKSLLRSEETDLAAEIVDLVYESPKVKLGVKTLALLDKHFLGSRFVHYKERRGLDQRKIEEIQSMSTNALSCALPRLFAEDLNEAMGMEGAPGRVALFFDTHEAFWDHERDTLPNENFYWRDQWLRSLLNHLRLDLGIVVALSGREPPRWHERGIVEAIDRRRIDYRWVGYFSKPEAEDYLKRTEILDPDMQLCLMEYARVAEEQMDQIHPLYLSLCVDVVWVAWDKGFELSPQEFREGDDAKSKGQRLVDKLLSYADSNVRCAVRALSAARDFDRETYMWFGKELDFEASRDRFEKLTRFSFVWSVGGLREGRYQIHELIRRILKEQEDELRDEADEKLRDFRLEETGGWPKRPGAKSSLVL